MLRGLVLEEDVAFEGRYMCGGDGGGVCKESLIC